RPHQPPDASEMGDLIHDLTEHLQDKRIRDDKKHASVELQNDPPASTQKRIVFKIADTIDDRGKSRAFKALSKLHGIDQLVVDMKEGKLTVVGGVDPVLVVSALRAKFKGAHLISVGPSTQVIKPEGRASVELPNDPRSSVQKKIVIKIVDITDKRWKSSAFKVLSKFHGDQFGSGKRGGGDANCGGGPGPGGRSAGITEGQTQCADRQHGAAYLLNGRGVDEQTRGTQNAWT
uniref:HMA domain-containing protein n=1 Tax=Aegilops tauschii subsp. strangulata TaxID=200361 RepID=A0A453A9K4_AEGTS